MRTAIIFGSSTGQTEIAAKTLKKHLDPLVEVCVDVSNIGPGEIMNYDVIIIGVSTWDIGQIQYDWETRIFQLEDKEWSNKHVAFFGTGDAIGYDDTFVDAFGLIWEKLEPRGANLLGLWPTEDYTFSDSASLTEDRKSFIGLPLDDDNEPEKTNERIRAWAEKLQGELRSIGNSPQVEKPASP
ncbi:MAG: flavodoxin [Myxococcota bacterium]